MAIDINLTCSEVLVGIRSMVKQTIMTLYCYEWLSDWMVTVLFRLFRLWEE